MTDLLVKTAAWTHNTNVNRVGFSPLTLVTGEAVRIPGLTTGNVAGESMTDAEAVRNYGDYKENYNGVQRDRNEDKTE